MNEISRHGGLDETSYLSAQTADETPEVGPLHEALSFLGLSIADEETSNQRFGVTTRAAVRKFQVDHKLPEAGEVDGHRKDN